MAHMRSEHSLMSRWSREESLQCPLCLQTTGDSQATGFKHLIRHMEEIAIGVLPASFESDSDCGEISSETSSVTNEGRVAQSSERDSHGPPLLGIVEQTSLLQGSLKSNLMSLQTEEHNQIPRLPSFHDLSEIADVGREENARREERPWSRVATHELEPPREWNVTDGTTAAPLEVGMHDKSPRLEPFSLDRNISPLPPPSVTSNTSMPLDPSVEPPSNDGFQCAYQGCNAPPFQTQYLLK